MRRKFAFLWITDPWETLDRPKDTTLRLAEESLMLGYESYWADSSSVSYLDGRVFVEAFPLDLSHSPIQRLRSSIVEVNRFNSIHYRVDPPVNLAYLHPLLLLSIGTEKSRKAQLVNPASVLLGANEKLEAAIIPGLMPESCIASRWETLSAFGRRKKMTVLKPMNLAQSRGVELLRWEPQRTLEENRRKLSAATDGFTRPVILQVYLKEIERGETRLWFIDGRLLACARKRPLPGDFRVDMDRGSSLEATSMTPRQRTASAKISTHLRKRGIRLAAVDLIGDHVTDFNFTSPGLIRQIEQVLQQNLAELIIRSLVAKEKG